MGALRALYSPLGPPLTRSLDEATSNGKALLLLAFFSEAKDDMWRVEKEKAALREKLGISWGQAR